MQRKIIIEKRMGDRYKSAEDQAEKMKEKGNTCFSKDRLAAAIEAYTEAITLCPNNSVYWTNRALCHKRRNDWKWVESDCRKAIELDKDSVKALYMLGLAMIEIKQHSEGIKYLEKAMELSKMGKNDDYVVITSNALAKAKYEEWECVATLQLQKQEELRKICERSLSLEHARAIKQLESLDGKSNNKVIHIDDDEIPTAKKTQAHEYQHKFRARKRAEYFDLCKAYEERCHTLSEVFEKAAQCNRPAEVGKFDPVTREPLTVDEIIPNYAIKEAVVAYLKDNGWAFKHE